MADHHHRTGGLSQSNKRHKTPGKAKASAVHGLSGRVERRKKGVKAVKLGEHGKKRRVNKAKQLAAQKRQDAAVARRLGHGGGTGAPKHVAVFALGPGADGSALILSLLGAAGRVVDEDKAVAWGRPITAHFPSAKTAMTFTLAERGAGGDVAAAVSTARFADVVLLALPVAGGATGDVDACVDGAGREFLTALKAAGVPAVVGALVGAAAAPGKRGPATARKWGAAVFAEQFPGKHCKVAEAENTPALLRALTTVRPKPVAWLAHRPYLLATAVAFQPTGPAPRRLPSAPTASTQAAVAAAVAGDGVPDPDAVEAFGRAYATLPETVETGTLVISGYLRGAPLHVDGLVAVAGVGTYPLAAVTAPADPVATGGAGAAAAAAASQGSDHGPVLATAEAGEVEPTATLAEEDAAAGEQTWPTAEEEAEAAAAARMTALTAAVGSKIQAVWLDGIGEGEEELAAAAASAALDAPMAPEDDVGTVADTVAPSRAALRAAAKEAEAEALEFPDEVDTPEDVPARARFGRYRGLRSFRASPWDAKESLPRSYARVFALGNFAAAHKAILKDALHAAATLTKQERGRAVAERAPAAAAGAGAGADAADVQAALQEHAGEGWVPQGRYVRLHIPGVPAAVVTHRTGAVPLMVTGLLPHEQRTSVAQFKLMRVPPSGLVGEEEEEGEGEGGNPVDAARRAPLKSKEPLEFVIGPRRVVVRPVFSEHNLNCDKAKFDKFLAHDRWALATAFAPITFGAVPVLVYRLGAGGVRVLVATGTAAGANPDAIILKRIVLSGYPVKCKRRGAMVKYMFYSPEDIRYFQPVEVWTKYGLVGRIREPVGTHGSMKCHFSGNVYSHDTVCMSLYKRVYPRWGESYRHLIGDALMDASVGSTLAGPLGTTNGVGAHPLDLFMAAQDAEGDVKL